ncbi:MAG: 5-histidylcysteine sulfoxide synthase [Proteobacteria bacterium]|nr:5-histidylcysteine sulfoxide synthase [Pseudomonadota bacterium]
MNISHTPSINSGDPEQKRLEIKGYFNQTFDLYESLFEVIADDRGYFQRADRLRHPLIFYFGHTATFFVNKLRVAKIINDRVCSRMEALLAIGVDEMSWDDLDEQNYEWPTVVEVQDYRNKVRQLVNDLIDSLPLDMPIKWEDPFWIMLMGIEHEKIHIETSSVLIRQLPLDWVKPHGDWKICSDDNDVVENQLIAVADGTVKQGKEQLSETYGWDNEYGLKITDVAEFKASKYLVSNKEFLAFVEDGAYEIEEWWTKEGWAWLDFTKATYPTFWVESDDSLGDKYSYRSMLEVIDMPWSWPVDVNYLEAKAFCNWLGAKKGKKLRLPTEPEYYRIYDDNIKGEIKANYNLDICASSCPVDTNKQGRFYDVVGNVWQWSETAIDGLKGFKVHPAYDDFSVPTFDGKHNLIKGSSWISLGNEILRGARYAFRRHFFQHAGFRYIESDTLVDSDYNMYETDSLISQYLEFHYGKEYFGIANFPKACIEKIKPHFAETSRALDIGCAVGRSGFELARYFDKVDALDFSTRFILNAIQLQEKGKIRYLIDDEGELTTLKEFRLSELELGDKAQNVEFTQGDACNLKPKYDNYDLIFAGNLIDRLYEPKVFLKDIVKRLNSGGLLIITSPYTWLEEYTNKENWLGGKKVNGENFTTLDGLHECLDESCEIVGKPLNVPFVIRETKRKHQLTVAQMTIWRKK